MAKPNSVAFNVANNPIRQNCIHSNIVLDKDGQSGRKDLFILVHKPCTESTVVQPTLLEI